MLDSHETLLQRLCRARVDADWQRFCDLYTPYLQRSARQLCASDDVDDLVQDVLVCVLEKLPTFAGGTEASFLAWLRTITQNRWRELQRRRIPRAADSEAVPEPIAPQDSDETEAADQRELLIRRALELMKAEFEVTTWQACWQARALQRPAAEIASDLGIAEETVHQYTWRVMRRLREEFRDGWR